MSLAVDQTKKYQGIAWNTDEVYAPLALALIQSESEGDPYALSRRGAAGLMQLMPFVYGDRNPYDPETNIQIGIKHLRWIQDWLHDRFPEIMPPDGVVPSGFALHVLVAAWVKGFAPGPGIADELKELKDLDLYKGETWPEFVERFPSWKEQSRWIEKVSERVPKWADRPINTEAPGIWPGGVKPMDPWNLFLVAGALFLALSVWSHLDSEDMS